MTTTPNYWTQVLVILCQLLVVSLVGGHRKYKHFPGTYTWGVPESGPISFSGGASSAGNARSVGFGDFQGSTTYGTNRGRWVGRATPLYRSPATKVVSSTIFVSSPGLPDNTAYNPYGSRRGGYGQQGGGFRPRNPSGYVSSGGSNRGSTILYSNDGFYREVDPREIIYGRALQGVVASDSQMIVTLNETDGTAVMINPHAISFTNTSEDSSDYKFNKEQLHVERLNVVLIDNETHVKLTGNKTDVDLAGNKTDIEIANTTTLTMSDEEAASARKHQDHTNVSPMSTDDVTVSRQKREKDIRFVSEERRLTTSITVTSGDADPKVTEIRGRSSDPNVSEERDEVDLPKLPGIDTFINGALLLDFLEPDKARESRMAVEGTRDGAETRRDTPIEPKESLLTLASANVESFSNFTDVPSGTTSTMRRITLSGLVLYFLLPGFVLHL